MAVRAVGRTRAGLKGLALAGFGIDFKSDSAGIISVLDSRYGRFVVPAGNGLALRAEAGRGAGLPFKPSVLYKGASVELSRGDFRALLDLRAGAGSLRARPAEQCLDAFLRALLSSLLLRSGGAMLHSACVLKDGRAHLFLGRSGAGKSTLSRLAAGAGYEVVSDEINLLGPAGRGFVVHGSPFWGEMRADGRPGRWPLAGVYLLKKARSNALAACGRGEAVKLLLRCLVNFERAPEISGFSLEFAASLLAAVRVRQLEFSKRDAAFMELL